MLNDVKLALLFFCLILTKTGPHVSEKKLPFNLHVLFEN